MISGSVIAVLLFAETHFAPTLPFAHANMVHHEVIDFDELSARPLNIFSCTDETQQVGISQPAPLKSKFVPHLVEVCEEI